MVTTIVGNVSIGPGEILFSILFKNVKKRDSKGDLDIGDKNVEIKASIGGEKFAELEKSADAGAVVAKGYGRKKEVKPKRSLDYGTKMFSVDSWKPENLTKTE